MNTFRGLRGAVEHATALAEQAEDLRRQLTAAKDVLEELYHHHIAQTKPHANGVSTQRHNALAEKIERVLRGSER